MNSKRTFIAIDVVPNQRVRALLEELESLHRLDSIKWVHPDIMHLTLFFLGDTSSEVIPEISQKLKDALSKHPPFQVQLKDLGTFGHPKPRVIWMGIDFPEDLKNLKVEINGVLNAFGIRDDKPTFKPHLTLGRIKFLHDIQRLKRNIVKNSGQVYQEVEVKSVKFYESILRQQGPLYKVIEHIHLKES